MISPEFLGALPPRFSLSGSSSDFDIHPETGGITTRIKLNREQTPFYTLTAYAEDPESGEACRSDVRIRIKDENTCTPKFSEALYTVTVKEDAPIGVSRLISLIPTNLTYFLRPNFQALIGKVHAEDGDSGLNQRLRYSLLSVISSTSGTSVIDDQFSLDAASGVISLLRPLDRELVPGYNLTIQVTKILPLSPAKVGLSPAFSCPIFNPQFCHWLPTSSLILTLSICLSLPFFPGHRLRNPTPLQCRRHACRCHWREW